MKTARMLVIVAVGVVLAGLAGPAAGTTWYVDANGSADFNSIQAALDDPCTVDGDQIGVAPGTYYEAIDFGGKAVRLYSSGGRYATTINANGADHVVKCVSGEDANTILEGFTITGGYADGGSWPDYHGGGMLNNVSSPTVRDCNFSGNTATQAGGVMLNNWSHPTVTNCTFSGNWAGINGGGIYNYESSPTLTNCTFKNNSAQRGSGMYNYGSNSSPTVTDCNFSGNVATNDGAGMYNETSTPTLTNCRFRENWAGINGGGIYNNESSPTVTNCMFSSNPAQYGGGMYNYNFSSPTVTNCTFSGNTASVSGGGMYNYNFSHPTVTNCIVWGNSPDQIDDFMSSSIAVTYSDVQGGYSGTGNIDTNPLFVDAVSGDLRLRSCSPCVDAGDNNSVPADSADLDGDGNTVEPIPFDLGFEPRFVDDAYVADTGSGTPPIVDMGAYERQMSSSSVPVYNITKDANYCSIQLAIDDANDGDVIEVAPGTYYEAIDLKGKAITLRSSDPNDANIVAGTIIDGTGYYHAAKCVNGEDANTVLEGFTITGGNAGGSSSLDYYGGGMLNNNSSPTVKDCIFNHNSAADGGGGMMNHWSDPTVTNCTFSNNAAGTNGGGIYNWESSPMVVNCRFSGNTGNYGGGMYNYGNNSSPTVTDCELYGNQATVSGGGMFNNASLPAVAGCDFYGNQAISNDGGGMCNQESSPDVVNCRFRNNLAGSNGGGLFNYINCSPTMSNCAFTNNSAQWGGGLYNYDNSNPTVTNCTFSGNTATDSGAGIMNNSSSTPTVTNCIVWGNSPDQIDDYDSPSSWATATYSDVQGGYSGTGNINAHPLFVNALAGNWHLCPNSPCVDAGDNAGVPVDVNTDLDGNFRFVDDANVADTGTGTDPIVDMGAYERQTDSAPLVSNTGVLYWSIQEAIDDGNDGDVIEVSPGTLNEGINFNGKAITVRSSDPNDANIVAATVIDGTGHYHIVQCVNGEDANTVLAGFTITGGNANGSFPDSVGGGMYCENSSPMVTNCCFTGNTAGYGAGIYDNNSSPIVNNCSFRNNLASSNGGGLFNYINCNPTMSNCAFTNNSAQWGGGMYNDSSGPTLTDCTFSGNTAGNNGGGMCNDSSSPTVINCKFYENKATISAGGMFNYFSSATVAGCDFYGNQAINNDGGGLCNQACSPDVVNCSFRNNLANSNGGGLFNYINCNPTMSNCAFTNNSAQWGGGLYNYSNSNPTVTNCTFSGNTATYSGAGIMNNLSSNPTVTNCILWGNSPDQIDDYDYPSSSAAATYSDVQGGYSGEGNINKHPLLLNVTQGDLLLAPWSPCIDAGNNAVVGPNAVDITGLPRLVDGDCNATVIVDMGAHEFGHTYGGDFDSSCFTNMVDFAFLAWAWLSTPVSENWNPVCDISVPADEYIDYKDLKILAGNWVCDVNTPVTCDANELKNVFALDAAGSAYVLKEVCGITDTFTVEQMLYQAGYSPDEYLESTALPFVENFAPVLYFDRAHKGLPMSAQVYFATMMSPWLWPWFDAIIWGTPWDGPCYPNCSSCGAMMIDGRDESNCGMQNNDFSTLTNGQVPTYYKVISDIDSTVNTGPKGRLRITYWWFYGFQRYCNSYPCDGDSGEHHGDWECITVTTNPERTRADAVTYFFHGDWYTKKWGGFQTVGDRPVVYVGKLAHGCYHGQDHQGWGDDGTTLHPWHCCEYADWRDPTENSKWYNAYQKLVSLRGSEPWMLADRIGTRYEHDGGEYYILPWRWGPHISYEGWGWKWQHVYACGTHPTIEDFNWDRPSCDEEGCNGYVCGECAYSIQPDEGWPWD